MERDVDGWSLVLALPLSGEFQSNWYSVDYGNLESLIEGRLRVFHK